MIVIDRPLWRWRGRRWSHLASDTGYDELHDFARRLGLERAWFQGDHYDVPEQLYQTAVDLGATPLDSRDLVQRLLEAGLRRPRRARVARG